MLLLLLLLLLLLVVVVVVDDVVVDVVVDLEQAISNNHRNYSNDSDRNNDSIDRIVVTMKVMTITNKR